MQDTQSNKLILELINKYSPKHPDSYLDLINSLNKLEIALYLINDDLEIVFSNHAFNQILSKSANEIINDFRSIKSSSLLKNQIKEHLSPKQAFVLELNDTENLGSFKLCHKEIKVNTQTHYLFYNSDAYLPLKEHHYKLLLEQLGFGVGYYTPEGIIVSYNNIAAQNMGGKSEDFTGKNLFDLFPKELAEKYLLRIKKCLELGATESYLDEVSLPTKTKWFKSSYSVVTDNDNNIIGVQIVSDDISELKNLEKRNNNLYRALDKSLNGFCIVNRNFEFTYANATYLKMWGYQSMDEIIGSTLTDHSAHKQLALDIKEKVKKLGVYTTDFKAIRKDGSLFDARIFIRTEKDDNGETIYPSSVIDISDRQLALNELQESETKFKAFIDHVGDGVVILDEHAKVSFVNEAFCKILNLTESEILNSYGWDLIYSMSHRPGKDETFREQLKQRILDLLHSKHDFNANKNQTIILQNKTNKPIDVIESVFVFSTNKGKNIGVFIRDISDIIQTEKEMQSAYELLSETEIISKSGSWTNNPTTGEGSWSKGSYLIRGASTDLTGNSKNHEAFMHPHDLDRYRQQFDKNSKSSETEFKQNYRLVDSKGNIKHIEAHYEIQRDKDGNAIFITGIDKDITDIVQAQKDLKHSEDRFNLAMNAAREGIWDWDMITNKVYYSPGWKKMLGYEENELSN